MWLGCEGVEEVMLAVGVVVFVVGVVADFAIFLRGE